MESLKSIESGECEEKIYGEKHENDIDCENNVDQNVKENIEKNVKDEIKFSKKREVRKSYLLCVLVENTHSYIHTISCSQQRPSSKFNSNLIINKISSENKNNTYRSQLICTNI